MEKVIVHATVEDKIFELIQVLYNNEYFGFLENAEKYVYDITNFIYNIPNIKHKQTHNPRYGAFYCTYKHNSKTSWYISFDIEGDSYNIKNIVNNHSPDYSVYIKALK